MSFSQCLGGGFKPFQIFFKINKIVGNWNETMENSMKSPLLLTIEVKPFFKAFTVYISKRHK